MLEPGIMSPKTMPWTSIHALEEIFGVVLFEASGGNASVRLRQPWKDNSAVTARMNAAHFKLKLPEKPFAIAFHADMKAF